VHIENVNINLGGGPLAAAALAALLGRDTPETEPAAVPRPAGALPKIGEAWPGIEGVYAGLSRGENGEPDAHLVLLNAKPDGLLDWPAAVKWAQGLGDDARLPTRFESALLYANLQDGFESDRWHWTGTQYSSNRAWAQGFSYGNQQQPRQELRVPGPGRPQIDPLILPYF
jgi:hypothetical protein